MIIVNPPVELTMKTSILISILLLTYACTRKPSDSATLDGATLTNSQDTLAFGWWSGATLTNSQDTLVLGSGVSNLVVIGDTPGLRVTNSNCILIGDNAPAPTNDWMLVIRFADGSILSQELPHKLILLRKETVFQ
jgi:hypothetical protein